MDITNIIAAVAVLFIMGILFAILLGIAAKVFAVEVDERVPLVRECLPGANCGGCGYPGCDGMAAAIVEGTAPVNGCPVGGAASPGPPERTAPGWRWETPVYRPPPSSGAEVAGE